MQGEKGKHLYESAVQESTETNTHNKAQWAIKVVLIEPDKELLTNCFLRLLKEFHGAWLRKFSAL